MDVSVTKRKLQVAAVTCVLVMSLSACGSPTAAQLPENEETAEAVEFRDGFSIREISDDLFDRMKNGNTYKTDCIVPREDFRYLLVLHKDKEGNTHQGEMVVHKLIADDVLEIFEKL